ncbi:GntR family transcriptional regulator [Rhizobium sp. L9]|uniref:aminotransferase-like domain-containing protein n=1 Tax=Rhizobium sp. L9 TaxID=1340738 RepID=UPI000BEA1C3B|nr:PLP-dependent aminotransferase family protein [Rhizobium sp. L9]PDT30787.1 GntR family transcriptional regulator [Rhizobium sp. L9]
MRFDWPHGLSLSAGALAEAPTFLALANQPDVISFAGGVPDGSLFPYETLHEAVTTAFSNADLRSRSFQYAPSIGYEPLRHLIAEKMQANGINADASRILITNGAQQALDLVGRLLIDPGDRIAVTAPTFFAAIDTFSVYRPIFENIPFNESGFDLDVARTVLSKRPKFLYLIPDFQNPTGLCISKNDRLALLKLCIEFEVPIVEDSPYERLRFTGDDISSVASMADEAGFGSNVIYINSFSKTIAPGLRVGWLSACSALIKKLSALKLAADVHASVFNQIVVAHVASTVLPSHVETVKKAYHAKRNRMIAALSEHMPRNCKWTEPEGGLFVWLQFPEAMDTSTLLSKSLAVAKVAFVPGVLSYADRSKKNFCRLSFATASAAQITEGIERLGKIVAHEGQDDVYLAASTA